MKPPPKARKTGGRRAVRESAAQYEAIDVDALVGRVVDLLGVTVVADLLGVSKSQPSRWRSGRERVSSENLRRLVDLDYILSRLLLVWLPEVVPDWLNGYNVHLGARPIDVMAIRGPLAVMDAVAAAESGSYA